MKKLLKSFTLCMGVCAFAVIFMACRNNTQNTSKDTDEILIKSITLDGKACLEGKDVFVAKDRAELIIELKEIYEDISVKVNKTPITTTDKTIKKHTLQGITDAGITVNIELTAKNKKAKTFKFVAKKADEVVIKSVRLDGNPCTENATEKVKNTTSELSVTLEEAYEELNVKVNGKDARIEGKVAKTTLENITEAGVNIEIIASAKNKASKTFKFKVVLKLEEIDIESVTFDGNDASKDAVVDTNKTEGDVAITFKELYENLVVKINGEPKSLSGKVATGKISNIGETETKVEIEATAKNRKPLSYSFNVRKVGQDEIGIVSVKFDDVSCKANATIETEKTEGSVKVTFLEEYAGLVVKINDTPVAVSNREATHEISNITTDMEIKINATATGKQPKEYKFNIHKVLPKLSIKSLTILAKEIGQSDQKTYSEGTEPLLADIANDGSTKVGAAKEPKIKIKIGFKGSPPEQKLRVENTTTNESVESTSGSWGAIETDPISLKNGDNNIVVTYSEKGFQDLVYKFIVEYVEPEYVPIKFISIGGIEYKTKEELEKLTTGSEKLIIDGEASIDVQVEMPEIWYNDEGWSIKVGGTAYQKTDFEKVGYSELIYRLSKKVPLMEGKDTLIKIEFANPTRSFTKEYKATVTHMIVYKLKNLIFMNPAKENEAIGIRTHASYEFDGSNNYYAKSTHFSAEDRNDKALFAVEAEDADVTVQYAFLQTKLTLAQITEWKPTTKQTISYKDTYDLSQTIEAYAIKDQKLEFASNYLYLCLQKGTTKIYYLQEIQRERLPDDNAQKNSELKVYKDADGTVVQDSSPISAKGLIKVLPKSPRATVKLATPKVKDFVLNTNSGYYECEIELDKKTIPYSYYIIAENGTTKELYKDGYDQKFTKNDAIRSVKHAYKVDAYDFGKEDASQIDDKWYVNFDKKEVKEKKIYLSVEAFSGVSMSHADFVEKSKDDNYGTNYVFEVNVSSIVDTPNTNKEYTLPLTLSGKPCGNLNIVLLPKNEIIQGISINGKTASLMPAGDYVCKADMDKEWSKKLIVWLYFIDENEKQNPEGTNRAIKVFKNDVEIPMTVYGYERNKLQFENNSFNIADKEKVTLKIKYFADKNSTTPTNEYNLEIEDL